ncbi:hypothetical protein SARC_03336 [Sphaeroforma arctica JP610]|uniref:Uncharacterized protein n=1 Tax=Sphaeroforma arctica JP610 TaxID=667725 RepID=A0A0L0G5Y6_9EUKA|nr:hypothetical protein SARC_03336 [Sphaeroforma arctica JP610]KNC84440.1 hypothetical protein SARC_03336 [Sphaeroforma arctica JP610]|eukprot:XP_014158342.1 hypothetical protein SARC_03336 [Sphaeroforma arctica JP610]
MSDPFAQFNPLPQKQTTSETVPQQQSQQQSQPTPMQGHSSAQNITMHGNSFQQTNALPQFNSYQQGLPVIGDTSGPGSQQSMNPNLGVYTPQQVMYNAQPPQMGGLMPVQPMSRPRFNTYSVAPGTQQGPPTISFQNMSLTPQMNQQQPNYDEPQVSQPMRFRSHAVSVSDTNDENSVSAPFTFAQPVVETKDSLDPFDMFDPVPRARGKTVGASSAYVPPEHSFGQPQQNNQGKPQSGTVDPFDLFLAVNAESRSQTKDVPLESNAKDVALEVKPDIKVESEPDNNDKSEKSELKEATNTEETKGEMDVKVLRKKLFFYPGHRGYIVEGIKHRRALGGKYSVKPLRAAAIKISADKDGVIIMSQEGKSILHRFAWEKIKELHHVHTDKIDTPLNKRTRKNFIALQLIDGSVFVINSKQTPEIRALFDEANPKMPKDKAT